MVVTQRGRLARLPLLTLISFATAALAATSGCAVPWLDSVSEADFPHSQSQSPRIYPKAISPAHKPVEGATAIRPQDLEPGSIAGRPTTPPADLRMAQEIERLKQLNDELSKKIAKTPTPAPAAVPQQPKQAESKKRQEAIHESIGEDLKSEFVEAQPAQAEQPQPEIQLVAATDGQGGGVVPAIVEQKPLDDKTKPAEPAEKQTTYQAGDWLKVRDQAIAQLQEEIASARLDKERAAEVGQLETLLRMHHALAGRRDDAVRPVKELPQQEQEFWRSEALGLIDLLGSDRLANESRRFAVALKSLEEAESHLAAAGSLALRNIALCRRVQDFGVVERFKTTDFKPNQEVLLYVEIRNFTALQKEDQLYETELQGSFRVLDRSGVARAERTLPLDKQTCANLRRDYYIAYRLYIPSELSPGSYTLELTIEDKKGNKSNNALLDFNVTQ